MALGERCWRIVTGEVVQLQLWEFCAISSGLVAPILGGVSLQTHVILTMSTMLALIRSDVRLLLTNRSPKVTNKNDKLPEDVLLEIFYAYRQLYELQPDTENLWNSIDGWIKLAHVCIPWRRVVLSSSTHLHMHLLFTPHRSARASMLKNLPRFPILVNYSATSWTAEEENRALEALRHRDRVRGIILRGPCPAGLLKAMRHTFSELESLQICPVDGSDYEHELVLPAKLLSGSAPRLQRLTLRKVAPASLSPLLSFTTGLVELTIAISTVNSSPPVPSLIPNLQRMSSLRRLELDLKYRPDTFYHSDDPPVHASPGDGVPLPKLTHLIFSGHRLYLQELVVGLATPSLQHFTGSLLGTARDDYTIPHLCKFVKDTGCQFTSVRLEFSRTNVAFHGSLSSSAGDRHFILNVPEADWLAQLTKELAGPLSTVEELIVVWNVERWYTERLVDTDQWRGFFNRIPRVTSVQVPGEVALDIARSFKQGDREPVLDVLDLLPTLQQLEVRSLVGEGDHYASIRDAYRPLVAARQRAGRSLKFSWSLWSYKDEEKWLVR
ncbi:hypothetical protein EI94DRAFT_1721458 [Lactarius quietus]|nr:hypothetical protein EI94DRAFT_1721458 [Lactarius quietus]